LPRARWNLERRRRPSAEFIGGPVTVFFGPFDGAVLFVGGPVTVTFGPLPAASRRFMGGPDSV